MKIKNKSQTNLFAKITYTETKGNVFLFKTYNKPLNEKKRWNISPISLNLFYIYDMTNNSVKVYSRNS